MEDAKKAIAEITKEMAQLQKKLPSNIDNTKVVSMLENITTLLNIQNPKIQFQREENKGFYFTNKYKIDARGTFLQFLLLLEKLAEADNLINIQALSLRIPQERPRGRFTMIDGQATIELYRYNEQYTESCGSSSSFFPGVSPGSRSDSMKILLLFFSSITIHANDAAEYFNRVKTKIEKPLELRDPFKSTAPKDPKPVSANIPLLKDGVYSNAPTLGNVPLGQDCHHGPPLGP